MIRAERAWRVAAVTVLALATLLISGCGPVSLGTPKGPSSQRIPAYDTNPTPREQVVNGGTLRWPIPALPTQWNLHHVDGAMPGVGQVVRGALPHLMRTDERGVARPVPAYLLSAVSQQEQAEQTVTYRLNPRARWSDGRPVGYRDLAAQAYALSGRDGRYRAADVTGYRQIQRVERGADDHEVKVTFARTYANWPSLFSPLYPAAAYADPAAFDTAWKDRLPVTAGPFKLQRIDRTAETVTVVRDPAWWGAPAKLDRIVYRAMDTRTMPGAFAGNEIDLMDVGLDAGALHRVLRVRGAAVRRADGPDWRYLMLNPGGRALSDARVRRAVVLALDRGAIARSVLSGLGVPVQPLDRRLLIAAQDGRLRDAGESGDVDLVSANRLLDEAGWPRRGRYRAKAGRVLALRFLVPAEARVGEQEGELTRALLERVGVRVDMEPGPTRDVFDHYVRSGRFGIAPLSWPGPHPGRETFVVPLYRPPQMVAVRADLANMGACGSSEPAYEDIGFRNPA